MKLRQIVFGGAGPVKVVGALIDISRRRQAEEQLRPTCGSRARSQGHDLHPAPPPRRARGPARRRAPAFIPPPDQPLSILVVEDNVQVGEFAVQICEELGHSPVLAMRGEEALAVLERQAETFDLVFSDVVMPGRPASNSAKKCAAAGPACASSSPAVTATSSRN